MLNYINMIKTRLREKIFQKYRPRVCTQWCSHKVRLSNALGALYHICTMTKHPMEQGLVHYSKRRNGDGQQ